MGGAAELETLADYELLDELGRGGMGRVVRARHRPSGGLRALKLLEGSLDPELLLRFRREAEVLARVGGEGVVPVHAWGSEQGRAWLAMALMPGGSLAGRLKAAGRLPWREAVELVLGLSEALGRCHAAGVVHRDLKPENVLFDEQGRARLADFGAVRDLGASTLGETGATIGTPAYMAPEQLTGEPVDGRADLYALGVTLHQLVSGALPFAAPSLSPVALLTAKLNGRRERLAGAVPDVPPALDLVLDRTLAPDPARRLASAAELAAALRAVLAGRGLARARAGRAAWIAAPALALAGLGLAAWPAAPPPPVPTAAAPPPARPGEAPRPEPADALLDEARASLRARPGQAAALVAAVESALAAGATLGLPAREAFLGAACQRAELLAQSVPTDCADPARYREAIAPWLLARRVAALPPALPLEPPRELVSVSKQLRAAHSLTNELELLEALALYVPFDPGPLAGAVADAVHGRLRAGFDFARAKRLMDVAVESAPRAGWPRYVRAELVLEHSGWDQVTRDALARADLLVAREDPHLGLDLNRLDDRSAWVCVRLAAIHTRADEHEQALELLEGAPGSRQYPPWTLVSVGRLHAYLLAWAGRWQDAALTLERLAASKQGDDQDKLLRQARRLRQAETQPDLRARMLGALRPN